MSQPSPGPDKPTASDGYSAMLLVDIATRIADSLEALAATQEDILELQRGLQWCRRDLHTAAVVTEHNSAITDTVGKTQRCRYCHMHWSD